MLLQVEVSDDLMLLTYERCCMLQCQKVGLHFVWQWVKGTLENTLLEQHGWTQNRNPV